MTICKINEQGCINAPQTYRADLLINNLHQNYSNQKDQNPTVEMSSCVV